MEDQAWKIIIWATVFTLVVLGFAYFLISPRESPYLKETDREKSAEFKSVYVTGRKEGKKSWEFFAESGWSTKDQEMTYLTNVSRGNIYKDGELIVKNLVAKRAKAYRTTNVVESFGKEEGSPESQSKLLAYIDLGRVSDKEKVEWIKLIADYLKYYEKEKKSEASGKVKVVKKDSQIFAEKIYIDHEKKIANIKEDVILLRKDGKLSADEIEYLGEEEKLIAKGKVNFKISEKNKRETLTTKLKCEKASFFTDSEKDLSAEGSLEVIQKHKMSVAQAGTYIPKKKELILTDGVTSVIEKAGAILKEETAKKLSNPDVKNILKEKTILRCRKLTLSTFSGNGEAVGSVEVFQKGREAKADFGKYNDQEEILILTGNAFLKKEKDWVKCKEVVVSVRDETFEAKGQVEAEFKL